MMLYCSRDPLPSPHRYGAYALSTRLSHAQLLLRSYKLPREEYSGGDKRRVYRLRSVTSRREDQRQSQRL
jgi:hypothetical protein